MPPPARTTPEVIDLNKLPILRGSDRQRHGLDRLQLNMVGVATERRPTAFAIINLNKVYIGETIPDTNARLIAVGREGIGIEIVGSGQRYLVQF